MVEDGQHAGPPTPVSRHICDPLAVLRQRRLRRVGDLGLRRPKHPLLSPEARRRKGMYFTKTQLLRMLHNPVLLERRPGEWQALASGGTPALWDASLLQPGNQGLTPTCSPPESPRMPRAAAAAAAAACRLPPAEDTTLCEQPDSPQHSPVRPRRTSATTRCLVVNSYDDWVNPYTGAIDRHLPPSPPPTPPPVDDSDCTLRNGSHTGVRLRVCAQTPMPIAAGKKKPQLRAQTRLEVHTPTRRRQLRYRQLYPDNRRGAVETMLPELALKRQRERQVRHRLERATGRGMAMLRVVTVLEKDRSEGECRPPRVQSPSGAGEKHNADLVRSLQTQLEERWDTDQPPKPETILSGKDGVPLGADVTQYLRMRAMQPALLAPLIRQQSDRSDTGSLRRESGMGGGSRLQTKRAPVKGGKSWMRAKQQVVPTSPGAELYNAARGARGVGGVRRVDAELPQIVRSRASLVRPDGETKPSPNPGTLPSPSVRSTGSDDGDGDKSPCYSGIAAQSPVWPQRNQPTKLQQLQRQLAVLRQPHRAQDLRAFVASLRPRDDAAMSRADWDILRVLNDAIADEKGNLSEKALKSWGWSLGDRRIDQTTFRRIDKSRTGKIEFHELVKFFYPQMSMRDIKVSTRIFERMEQAERSEADRRVGPGWINRFPARTVNDMYLIFQRFGADPDTGLLTFDSFLHYLRNNESRIPFSLDDLREIFDEAGADAIDLERFSEVIAPAFEEDDDASDIEAEQPGEEAADAEEAGTDRTSGQNAI
eukprot:TRINITY_DN12571_c0_g1_i4.p1 TRINITY_DN12571_c0_g1~~TRINITY_DN12571_c0_g1_i4.p1  ORF type:complete len:778 (+),score=110.92 TRINITY_DN12571_c0_g1_i4:45-2336(+)